MRINSSFARCSYALAILGLGCWSRGAWAQPGEWASLPPVSAPAVQEVAPLGVKGTETAGQEGRGKALLEVSVSAPKVVVALKKLRAGEMTPQQAWDSGALDVDDLIYFLEKGLDSWGGFFYEKDPELRRALVALLVEHGSEKLQKPEALSPTVRLWLADYYGSIRDERVVDLAESILAPMKSLPGENALGFQAIERIAWFNRDQGQYEKGAQTWLRMDSYHQDAGWWQPDSRLEAARLYQRAGEEKKAEALYNEIKQGGNSSFRGMATYDQAFLLMDAKPAQARDLVLNDLEKLQNPEDRIGPLWVLAQAQWKLESWSQAEATLQELLKACVEHPSSREGVDVIKEEAQGHLQSLRLWKIKPFDLPLKNLVATRDRSGVLHARLYVHSWNSPSLRVKFEDAGVEAVGLAQQRQHRTGSGVLVTVFDLTYRVAAHPKHLSAQVFAPTVPQVASSLEILISNEKGN